MKKITQLLGILLITLCMCQTIILADEDVTEITLSSVKNSDGSYTNSATINNESVKEYDYTWNVDPSTYHKDVKNSPAEYYTGEKPEDTDSIYIAHDIYYYPELDSNKYVLNKYGDDNEWLYYYEIEGYEEYIFATLPNENNSVPTRMMHSASEAYSNSVLHITKAGTYRLSGEWHGQIYVDLGEDAFDDPSQIVTLILNNVDINCTVASGIVFKNVYEVDNTWEDKETYTNIVDTTNAGANIIIADGSTNNVSGTNIYRILKTKYKDENSTDAIKEQKKSLKVDGALYSYMSLNVDGESNNTGILNINSEFEGLDSELHLTINGGNVNIVADNDGINVNEDNVSIFTMNDGCLQILAGTGAEGDGIDSNGFITINGGTIISSAKPQADSGLDSDKGTYINGGNVIATGSSMDVVSEYSEDTDQLTMNLVFSSQTNLTDSIVVTDNKEKGIIGFDLSKNEFFKNANRTYQCLIISTEDFKINDEYYVYKGATIKGTNTNGVYTKINSINNGSQLAYSSIGGGKFNPGSFNPQGNTDFDPTNIPGENGKGGMNFDPNNQQGGNIPGGSGQEGMNVDPNNQQGGMNVGPNNQGNNTQTPNDPTDQNGNQNTSSNSSFLMDEMVKTFSGVSVYQTNASSNLISLSPLTLILGSLGIFVIGAAIGSLVVILIKKNK